MSETKLKSESDRKSAWVLKRHADAIERLKQHPAIPFRAALDEVVELGIKAVQKTRGRQRRAQTVVQG